MRAPTGTVVACCPTTDCHEPLVETFIRPGKEFVCMVCGSWWEWLQPLVRAETSERMARLAELQTQFDVVRGLYRVGLA